MPPWTAWKAPTCRVGYDRIGIAVELAASDARVEAWTYVKERARIEVIHSEMLEEYHLDPKYVPASGRKG